MSNSKVEAGSIKKNPLIEELHEAIRGKSHIVWDWNGTLLNDVDHAVLTVNTLLKEHSLPLVNSKEYREHFGFPVKNYYEMLGFDFSRESFESLCSRFVDRFMCGIHDLSLIPEMKSVLMTLHQEGFTQSILSATDQENLDSLISHFKLDSVFQFVFGVDNKLAGSKLERGRDLIRTSQISTSSTIIIGDTIHDLEVARELGVDVVLVGHGHQCPKRLRKHHDKVIAL